MSPFYVYTLLLLTTVNPHLLLSFEIETYSGHASNALAPTIGLGTFEDFNTCFY